MMHMWKKFELQTMEVIIYN